MPRLVAPQLETELSQGDVFQQTWDDDRTPSLGSVIVLSEACEIDNCDSVLFAPFVRDDETEAGLLANVTGGKVWRAFHVAELGQPGWADLRRTSHAPKQLFTSRLDRREASLTPEGRTALAGWMFAFLTHEKPPAAKYFRDSAGVVWDVWEVTAKDVGRTAAQVRQQVPGTMAAGWLCFTSPRAHKRLVPSAVGWQYYTDEQLEQLTQQATAADLQPHCVAAEQAAKARAGA